MCKVHDYVSDYLCEKGFKKGTTGYFYMRDAIVIAMDYPQKTCKEIFSEVSSTGSWSSPYNLARLALLESKEEHIKILPFIRVAAEDVARILPEV